MNLRICYKLIEKLNNELNEYGYQITKSLPKGKPTSIKDIREIRLSKIDNRKNIHDYIQTYNIIEYFKKSKNSTKFPSYLIEYENEKFDLVLSSGDNKGQTLEKTVLLELQENKNHPIYRLCSNISKKSFKSAIGRVGSTKKLNANNLGDIIADIFLIDENDNKHPVSLKNYNGDVISTLPYAKKCFIDGMLNENSLLWEFLSKMSVDLAKVQFGFNERNNTHYRLDYSPCSLDENFLRDIIAYAWGKDYFYAKCDKNYEWKIFWLCDKKLEDFTTSLQIDKIDYPNKNSKQLSIHISNEHHKYKIEVRNVRGKEYPNDIKVKYYAKSEQTYTSYI